LLLDDLVVGQGNTLLIDLAAELMSQKYSRELFDERFGLLSALVDEVTDTLDGGIALGKC